VASERAVAGGFLEDARLPGEATGILDRPLRERDLLRDAGRMLVPVWIVDAHSSDASSGTMRTPIEVELRNGVRVRVHADFVDQVFHRVLSVANRC